MSNSKLKLKMNLLINSAWLNIKKTAPDSQANYDAYIFLPFWLLLVSHHDILLWVLLMIFTVPFSFINLILEILSLKFYLNSIFPYYGKQRHKKIFPINIA